MTNDNKADRLRELVQLLANERPDFFTKKGPGMGNLDTNAFIYEVRVQARSIFGKDYSEQKICGNSNQAVDFYFEDEATIVELALGLKGPNSEFEKDILKALLAKEKHKVQRLVLIGKPGTKKKCLQPGRKAVQDWVWRHYGIVIDVYDIENNQISRTLS